MVTNIFLNTSDLNERWCFFARRSFFVASLVCYLLAVFIIAIFVGIILILGIVKNEPIQDLVARLMIILPMAKWLVSIIAGLNEDIERLKELDNEFDQTKNKTMSELQMIQKSITEHRKAAVKIPNAVYRMFKDNDEDREHRIATMDAELK